MAEINRNGSPMNICDESLDGEPGAVEKRKRDLESKQNSRSSFLIGTIEDVNRKIGKLEQRLQSYTQLVVESRASDHPDAEALHPTSARGRMRYQERERENRDVCKFAGIYTLKSTFLPNLSDRMKNISKISMNPSKEKLHVKKDKDPSKPRFVELHQYPGYDPLELTPLPGHDATEIFQIVVDASVNLDKKPKYEPEFKRLFFSPMSQAVLQDTFWYVFLDSFQPNPTAQQKLFNRVAHNYVKLIFYAKNPLFRDTFLKEYPRLMAQALYVSFCHCFSDSYRQFGETFKNDLMYLVYGWIAGIRPSPRCWLEWNFTKLEPANINSKEDILNKSKNKTAMSFNFDYLDSLVSSHPSQYPSSLSLNQSASKSSVGSNRNQRRNRHTTRIFSRTINPLQTHCSSSPGDKQASVCSSRNFSMASESAVTPDRKPTIKKKSFTEPQRLLKREAVVNFVFMPESAKTEKESLLRECGSLPKFFTPNRTGSKDSLPGVRRNFGKEGSFGMTRRKLQEEYSESTDGPEKMTHQGFTDSVQAGEYRNVLDNSKPVSIQTQVTHGRQPPNKKTDDSRDTPTHRVSWSASTERTEELDETTPPDKTAANSNLIEAVADAQSSPLKSTARESLDTQRSSQGKQTVRDVADTQRSLNPKHGGKDKEGIEALSPIREMTSEEEAQEKKRSQYSVSVMRDSAKKTADHEMKSHPAFTGPDFLKAAFNLNGRSPLVAHFLRMRNLTADMNLVVRIQHTEIDNLPPIDAPTYQDVIKQSSRTVGTIGKQFQEMFAKNQKETATFLKRERKVLREHRRRENALLANKPEVKRLSDLLVLDQGRGLDSISAGSSKAVEASLMAHELP
ncbi:uncharacterized protein [Littorina saxatilis]|uniref:uncharacterized protein isoform X2 n=1 Tax=Littorina saxatilis TaxID=31220 RepID=UPI0038B45B3C